MTRAVSTQFAAATLPSLPALDADLLGLANLIVVACTATGTNAVALTPVAATVTVSAYSDKEMYAFNAPATSTGVMTVQISSGAVLKLFKPGGTIQATTGDVVSAQFYLIAYQAALDTGTGGFIILNATNRQPTRTVLTSGSGTYTTPTGATRLNIRLLGGGGGGGGSGTSPGASGVGGTTTFGVLSAVGGSGTAGAAGTSGGNATGGDINITGGSSQQASGLATAPGAAGGPSVFGGVGINGQGGAAGAAPPNAGGGGSGAGSNGTPSPGGGGGGGGYCEKLITAPSATYSYAVGASGAAGTAGTGGFAGGAGGSGIIIIDEFYN